MPGAHSHRSGALRQKNKSHKNAHHATKRGLKKAQGGKQAGVPLGDRRAGGGQTTGQTAKAQRLLQTKQSRQRQRARIWLDRRRGSKAGAPRSVLVLPLSRGLDSKALLRRVAAAAWTGTTCRW